MKMNKLSMCRVCLVENVRMYVVANKNLQEIYGKLTDAPFVTEDRRPMLTCYFCCTKLKQCWRLQRKCLEAEKLFAQMLEEDYETKPQLNQNELEFSGYTISPTENVSIFDGCQTENDAIKEELLDVCEGQAIENQTELQPHHFESEVIPGQYCESEDETLLMDFKTEVKEEPEYIPTHLSILRDIPPNYSESDSDDEALLIKLNTRVKKEKEVSEKKRKANKTKRATVAKKPKRGIRRPKPEDTITVQQKKTEHQHQKNITPNRDQRLCIKEKPYKCVICLCSFTGKSALTKHTRKHTGENLYKCEYCQRCFAAKVYLKRHIRVHTGEKPYKCNICQRSFTQKGSLTIHSRVHTGEKPFKCNICQRCYTRKATLKMHARVHTGEKPYKCDICQRSFSTMCSLKKHIRVHTGEKSYKCDICQRGFTRKDALGNHIRVHTGEKPYKCDICQRSFAVKSYLTLHVRVHMYGKKLKCDLCQCSYTRAKHLKRHMLTHTK